jgi:hypothetical protein
MSPYTIPSWSRRLALLNLDPLELFDAWWQAEHDASITLARWRDAEDGAKANAHAAYLAALEREAHAADVLRRRVELPEAQCGHPRDLVGEGLSHRDRRV